MNHIQKLSQDLLYQRLKLQMGLDPRMDIDPRLLRSMWAEAQKEHRLQAAKQAPAPMEVDQAA